MDFYRFLEVFKEEYKVVNESVDYNKAKRMAGYLMRVKPLDWLQKQYKIKFDERKWKHNLANAGRRREQDDFITDYV